MPLEDSCKKFLVSWKWTLFYYKTVFWPTEINVRNCLLNLIKNLLAVFLNDTSTIFYVNLYRFVTIKNFWLKIQIFCKGPPLCSKLENF